MMIFSLSPRKEIESFAQWFFLYHLLTLWHGGKPFRICVIFIYLWFYQFTTEHLFIAFETEEKSRCNELRSNGMLCKGLIFCIRKQIEIYEM